MAIIACLYFNALLFFPKKGKLIKVMEITVTMEHLSLLGGIIELDGRNRIYAPQELISFLQKRIKSNITTIYISEITHNHRNYIIFTGDGQRGDILDEIDVADTRRIVLKKKILKRLDYKEGDYIIIVETKFDGKKEAVIRSLDFKQIMEGT